MRLILLMLGMLLMQSVWADWTKKSTENNSDGSEELTTYVDYESIRETDNGRSWWVLTDRRFVKGDPIYIAYKSVKTLHEFNCSGNQYRLLSTIIYSESQGKGAAIFSSDKASNWRNVIPRSVGANDLEFICKYQIKGNSISAESLRGKP